MSEEKFEILAGRGITALIEDYDLLATEIESFNQQQKEAEERYQDAVEKALAMWRKEASVIGRQAMHAAEKQSAIIEAIRKLGVSEHV